MMVQQIIQELATRIGQLGFVSQSGAIAHDLLSNTKLTPAALVYPLFDKSVFVSPDAKESAITFFQVGPTRAVNQDTWLTSWENEITLIGWINGKRISEGACNDAIMQILRVVNRARLQVAEDSPVRSINIDFIGDSSGQPIGDKYGWNDEKYQYGKPPYKLFELRFRLTYFVAAGCCVSPVDVIQNAC